MKLVLGKQGIVALGNWKVQSKAAHPPSHWERTRLSNTASKIPKVYSDWTSLVSSLINLEPVTVATGIGYAGWPELFVLTLGSRHGTHFTQIYSETDFPGRECVPGSKQPQSPLYPAPPFSWVRCGSSEQGNDFPDATQCVRTEQGPGCGSRTVALTQFQRHLKKWSVSKGLREMLHLGSCNHKMDVKLHHACPFN